MEQVGSHFSGSENDLKTPDPFSPPATIAPEDRDAFLHPNLPRYVAAVRGKVLECLAGMLLNWVEGHSAEKTATQDISEVCPLLRYQ